MDEFTDLSFDNLDELADTVLKSFGDRYASEATRVLNTGLMLPGDGHMVQLALAITMGMYMKKIAENAFEEERSLPPDDLFRCAAGIYSFHISPYIKLYFN